MYILSYIIVHACLRAFGHIVYDTEKISMAPALRMTHVIKEKLPIFFGTWVRVTASATTNHYFSLGVGQFYSINLLHCDGSDNKIIIQHRLDKENVCLTVGCLSTLNP